MISPLFRRIAVIAPGLLGGSFALACKHQNLSDTVVAYARRQETRDAGLRLGAFDEAAENLPDAVRGADLVMLAAPVRSTLSMLESVGRSLETGALVTDVGSTKAAVSDEAGRCLPGGCFIGGHPMAGSHRSGIGAARADLFVGARYVLTRSAGVSPASAAMMEALVRALGARPLWMDPVAHDELAARASHLPHLAASALVHAAGAYRLPGLAALDLAASGFRDTTRVAAGDPGMWTDIVLTNPAAISASLDTYLEELGRLREMIARRDEPALHDWLEAAAAVRRTIDAADSAE